MSEFDNMTCERSEWLVTTCSMNRNRPGQVTTESWLCADEPTAMRLATRLQKTKGGQIVVEEKLVWKYGANE